MDGLQAAPEAEAPADPIAPVASQVTAQAGIGRRVLTAMLIGHVLLLTGVSLLPSDDALAGPLAGWDALLTPTIQNALHIPAYAVLVVLSLASLGVSRRGATPKRIITIAALCCVYGAFLEELQSLVPGRIPSWADIVWNTVGALLGAGLWSLLRRASMGKGQAPASNLA